MNQPLSILLVFIFVATSIISFLPINAEPLPYNKFLKKYETKIDEAIKEKLSPKQQIEIGIHMRDIVCFNEYVQIMKLSASQSVACVKTDTAKELVQRGWGMALTEELKLGTGNSSGCWFDWTVDFSEPIYDEIDKRSIESKIIRTVRISLSEFYPEHFVWSPIQTRMGTDFMKFTLGWSLDENPSQQMIENIKEIGHISRVTKDTTGFCN